MSDEIAPDFGVFLREAMGPNATFSFLPFQLFHIGRTGARCYTTTSRIRHGGTYYAVSIDFEEAAFEQLLQVLPVKVATSLRECFSKEFYNPQMVNLPFPFAVNIETRLGLPEEGQYEEFIPLIAVRILGLE